VDGHLLRYRIMANVVGVLLIVLVVIGVPLKYLATEGSGPQEVGEWITTYLGVAHGWLYMIFLVAAAVLARAARWSVPFTVVTLLMGTVPFASFVAERRATRRTREPATV
jgi:integral membrane protein